ncbi:Major Facilitator Superfamily (MFS) transporter [Phytophthora megakarya]|uniref:Major Facilitator Superfamily (MFS) transporter n=1 Tax=Phytophthora megakarya TaxID=4795 RepID=A0A225VFB4_9STRA|nr:Major Facilitator Superfamily (MFS) transporter [Phytophthora megakarya]
MGTRALQAVGVGVFLGAAFGGPFFGYLADARGRRSALLFAMILSSIGLALSAVAKTDFHAIASRIVAGVGLGGELPVATVLVQELVPRTMRGRMVALLEAFTGVGGLVGVALAFGVAPQIGWRNTDLVLFSCVLYTGVLRLGIPESPRWLASVGRVNEALQVVEKLERVHGVGVRYDNLKVQEAPTPMTVKSVSSVAKSKPSTFENPVQTIMLWILWTITVVSSYALTVYVPTLISTTGFNMYESWNTVVLLYGSKVLGCLAASWMLETRGRKQSIGCFATVASVTSILMSYLPWCPFVVIFWTCSVSAFLAGAWSCLLAYTPENYVTAVRLRGVSYAFGISRIGAAGGTLLYPYMFDVWYMTVRDITLVFAGLLAFTVLPIVLSDAFIPTTNGYITETNYHDSNSNMESGINEDDVPLVINATTTQTLEYCEQFFTEGRTI